MRGQFLLAAGLALSGCAAQQNVLQAAPAGPAARQCEARIENPGQRVDVFGDQRLTRMRVSNEGGWCGTYVRLFADESQEAWTEGTIDEPPEHGSVRLRSDSAEVHIEYRPNPNYVGADSFAVRLQPGLSIRRTEVEVTAARDGGGPRQAEAGVISSVNWSEPTFSAEQ
jgi:hypothetical protein